MEKSRDWTRVWDPVVRLGHWTLVTAFFIAWFTDDELLSQHVWAGYVVAGVVLVRLLWGVVGTEHARFGDFVRSPGATLSYLGQILTNRARRYIGHNPAGGAMILAMLASLAVTVFSGMEIYAIEENAGPLATIDISVDPGLIPAAHADNDEDSDGGGMGGEDFWEEVHEASANFTLFLVLLHVLGVLVASISHRENLVRAMITGRKRRRE